MLGKFFHWLFLSLRGRPLLILLLVRYFKEFMFLCGFFIGFIASYVASFYLLESEGLQVGASVCIGLVFGLFMRSRVRSYSYWEPIPKHDTKRPDEHDQA